LNDGLPADLRDLPDHWTALPLKEVIQKTHQTDPTRHPTARFKYVDVSSVSSESLKIIGHTEYEGKEAPSRARKEIRCGDVIFATVRPSLRRVAVVPPELDGQICSTAFCVLRAKSDLLDPGFLFYATVFDPFVSRVSEHQRGSSYPAVSDGIVRSELIPVPPLAEQQAIAHVLRTVQRAREATEKVIAAARQLKQSLMRHLFTYGPVPVEQADQVPLKETEIGPIPEHWKVAPLGEYVKETQYGLSKRGENQGKYPILRMNNLGEGKLRLHDLQYVDLDSDEFSKFALNQGDLLFNRTNSFELVGKTSLFNEAEPFVFASYLIRVTPDQARLHPGFLNFYMNLGATQTRLKQLAARAVSQSNINATKLRGLPILVPTISEQEEIASLLDGVETKLRTETVRVAALQALFTSLLHHLMTGKVRVNELEFPAMKEGSP
jgi:type I restriction enzyme S subunit